jgi:hypothetical protein
VQTKYEEEDGAAGYEQDYRTISSSKADFTLFIKANLFGFLLTSGYSFQIFGREKYGSLFTIPFLGIFFSNFRLYRTNGVSIFIDYCTAPRDTQKGGRRRKRHSTSTRV